MSLPKVSVLWVNYNGIHIRRILIESLEAIDSLDYENFELIVVDNGSDDGSYKLISDFFKRMRCPRKLIRLEKNLGFTGGNNIGFCARSSESKYVLLVNSDAVPYPESLRGLLEFVESDPSIGAAQGVILDYDTGLVDTAGDMVDELLEFYPLYAGSDPLSAKCPIEISYANAAFALYRVESVRKVQGERLFDDLFAYYEDRLLSFRMWNCGFRSVSLPFQVALHRRGSSFRRYQETKVYLMCRNYLFHNEILNSRYRKLNRLYPLKMVMKGLGWDPIKTATVLLKAERDCRAMVRKTFEKDRIDLYRAPIVRIDPVLAPLRILLPGRFTAKTVKKNLMSAAKPFVCLP